MPFKIILLVLPFAVVIVPSDFIWGRPPSLPKALRLLALISQLSFL